MVISDPLIYILIANKYLVRVEYDIKVRISNSVLIIQVQCPRQGKFRDEKYRLRTEALDMMLQIYRLKL
jgi:hypothetical protein